MATSCSAAVAAGSAASSPQLSDSATISRAAAGPALARFADEAVLGELPQVPRAVGGRLVQQVAGLGGRQGPVRRERLEQIEPQRVRQRFHRGWRRHALTSDRHESKVVFRKKPCKTLSDTSKCLPSKVAMSTKRRHSGVPGPSMMAKMRCRSSSEANSTVTRPLRRPSSTRQRVSKRSDSRSAISASPGRPGGAAAAGRAASCVRADGHQLLEAAHRDALGHHPGGQLVLPLGVVDAQQRPRVSGRQDAGGHPALHRRRTA